MKLYFLRHAAALDGTDDAARPLSPLGHRQARKLGRFLRRGGIAFDAAFTSPLKRARQTADIVLDIANELEPLKLEPANALINCTSADEFDRWLTSLPEVNHLLLVGHEPSLSQRVRRLIGLMNAGALPLGKGAMAVLETADRQRGVLKMLVSPKVLGVR